MVTKFKFSLETQHALCSSIDFPFVYYYAAERKFFYVQSVMSYLDEAHFVMKLLSAAERAVCRIYWHPQHLNN